MVLVLWPEQSFISVRPCLLDRQSSDQHAEDSRYNVALPPGLRRIADEPAYATPQSVWHATWIDVATVDVATVANARLRQRDRCTGYSEWDKSS